MTNLLNLEYRMTGYAKDGTKVGTVDGFFFTLEQLPQVIEEFQDFWRKKGQKPVHRISLSLKGLSSPHEGLVLDIANKLL